MTRDEAMERILDMIGDAYASGAVDVHSAWVADLGQLEPDFGEATSDYKASVAEAAATVIQQAFAERDGEMFGGTLNDDLRFILGQPSFTFIRHAQIWRAAGHELPQRAEDEQAFFIGRMLHHHLTVPSEWHDSWLDEIEAVQNEACQALAAEGDSRG